VTVNDDGSAYLGVEGNKANIEVKIEDATTVSLSFMSVGVKFSDHRIQTQRNLEVIHGR